MEAVDVFLKVEVDLGEGESAERLAREMIRTLQKIYGVRRAELQSVVRHGESDS
jgi:hypothetical protein